MLDKYISACLIFIFVNNVVADISFDYYFGFDGALREAKFMKDCSDDNRTNNCRAQCGSSYACFLGKCFCIRMKPQIKDDVLEELLEIGHTANPGRKGPVHLDNSFETEDLIPLPSDELALRPSLRHHIAHFCPNFDIARQCIRKCMLVGEAAFCGKDHVCYCGHKYDNYRKDQSRKNTTDAYGAFRVFYERYFGPQFGSNGNKYLVNKTTTEVTTTVGLTRHRHHNRNKALKGRTRPHAGARLGHAGARPGHAGARPGHAGASPGHARARPGHAGARPGHAGASPGHARARPGHAGARPGHAGASPSSGKTSNASTVSSL